MNGLKANRMKLRRYQRLKDWTESPPSVPFVLRIECITCSDSRNIWYLLFANAAVWEVGLKEMKVSRIEPEQTEDVDPLASSAFCVDIPRGILRANELESAPVRKWVLLIRCFDLYKILNRFLIIRVVNRESISSRSERLKWFPKPCKSNSQSRKGEQILCVEFINETEHLLLSVGPSGFGPKRTSVLSEPVAHGPQSSLNIESSEVNRVRSGNDRVNRIGLDLRYDDLDSESAIQLAPFSI